LIVSVVSQTPMTPNRNLAGNRAQRPSRRAASSCARISRDAGIAVAQPAVWLGVRVGVHAVSGGMAAAYAKPLAGWHFGPTQNRNAHAPGTGDGP
jgi:hypothetical protein